VIFVKKHVTSGIGIQCISMIKKLKYLPFLLSGLEADFVTWEENFWKVVHPATNMAKDDKPCCHGKGDSSCHGDGHDRTTYEVSQLFSLMLSSSEAI